MTQPHHRHHHPRYRKRYKVTNWQSYERSLIKRGDFTLWLSEDAIQSWYGESNDLVGRPQVYSDMARYKKLLSDQLRARGGNARQVVSIVACNSLSQFSLLGRSECGVVV